MSTFDSDDRKQEIIIVRRGGGDHEEGHHGGVWKIAFADFMTALMCFFLVMWLVNAANEETKSAIASYFNPMTLVDAAPASKGLDDPGDETQRQEDSSLAADKSSEVASSNRQQQSGPGQFSNSLDQSDTQRTSDQNMFADPYSVLAEIAAQTATLQNISSKGDGGAQTSGPATGAQGGESYRDPFAPDFWSQEVAASDDSELDVFRQPSEQLAAIEPEPEETQAHNVEVSAAAQPSRQEIAAETNHEEIEEGVAQDTQRLAEQIRDEIMEAFGRDSALNQTITVTARAQGVLISLTDELNYGMFQIGSAVPQGELVLAMETIGRTLNEQAGRISVNGHTDGRPFRSAEYDNWRLSTARAHAAYYMLVRGGVDESRIKEVAGFADRELKIPENPLADANRRIEIFLEAGG